jgi:hypothetical protein
MSDQMIVSEDEAFELLAHLVASAELHTFEPYDYVTMRLLDAASMLIGYMLRDPSSESHAWLEDLKREIDEKKGLRMINRDAYTAFLREPPAKVAQELMRRGRIDGRSRTLEQESGTDAEGR